MVETVIRFVESQVRLGDVRSSWEVEPMDLGR